MNWDDGKLFLAVARAGQMLGAARVLGVNQATLSRRMAQLEKSLGTSLLIRQTNGCTLTDDGQALMERLERVEAEFMQAQTVLSGKGMDVTGTVRIGAPDGFGTSFLAPRLATLADQHPGLTMQLVPVSQGFSLSKREADIAIVVGRPDHGRLIAQKLTDYTVSLYGAVSYLEKAGVPKDSGDLKEHRLVGYVDDLVASPSLAYAKAFWPQWQSSVEVSTATGQLEAVRGGAGIGVLHDYLAEGQPDLQQVLPDHVVTRDYWLVYHESLRGIARINAVSEFITTNVRAARASFVRE